MSDMADVLAKHDDWWWDEVTEIVSCSGCDWSKPKDGDQHPGDAFREHQAAALSAAGFGPVRTEHQRLMLAATLAYDAVEASALDQARAEAWDEGWAHYRKFFSPNMPEHGTNPYREASNDDQ